MSTAWAAAVRKRPTLLQHAPERVGHVGRLELADARGQQAGMVAFLRQGGHDQDRSEGVRFRRDRPAGRRWWRAVRWRVGGLFTRGCWNKTSTVTAVDADAAIAGRTQQRIRRRQDLHLGDGAIVEGTLVPRDEGMALLVVALPAPIVVAASLIETGADRQQFRDPWPECDKCSGEHDCHA